MSELATRRTGHPYIYRTSNGTWASLTWTRDPRGSLCVPQVNTSHPTWTSALARVKRWYASGKAVTW